MFGAGLVEPGVDAGTAIKLADKKQERGEGRAGTETFQHGLARHMVEGADGVAGQYRSALLLLCRSREPLE